MYTGGGKNIGRCPNTDSREGPIFGLDGIKRGESGINRAITNKTLDFTVKESKLRRGEEEMKSAGSETQSTKTNSNQAWGW